MLRTDYILRMVEQFQKVMALIVRARDAGDTAAAEHLLDQASREHLGLSFDIVESQPVAQLEQLFSAEGELDVGKCIVAGELLVQVAVLAQDRGEAAQAEAMRLRGLELLVAGYRVLPDRERTLYARKIVDLLGRLREHPFTPQELLRHVRVHEAAGRYDRAEDLLFALVDDDVDGALALGLQLYGELLRRKDADLEQGGLPRDEVLQGQAELQARRDRSSR
jgi:hypothetical protein